MVMLIKSMGNRTHYPVILLCTAILVFLSGCQGNNQYGMGPVILSPRISALHATYLKEQYPLIFTVSTDGQHASYYTCNVSYCGAPKERAIRSCENRSKGVPCKIYSMKRKVVWKGAVGNDDFSTVKVQMELLRKYPVITPEGWKGAVIYMPGYDNDRPIRKSNSQVPPYIRNLESVRWRAFKLYIVHEHRSILTLDKQIETLRKLVVDLKNKGFQRVILTGQSAGGWLALKGAADIPEVDGILAATPSKYGARVNDKGSDNNRFNQNTDATLQLLRKVRSKQVALAFFDGDPWEPAERAREIEAVLSQSKLHHIIIDHPQGVYGHHGAWSEAFRQLYSSCLDRFFLGGLVTKEGCRANTVDVKAFDPGDIDRSKLPNKKMRLSASALKAFNEKYWPLPVLEKGTYAYKFFAYAQGGDEWAWGRATGGIQPRNRAFKQAIKNCERKTNRSNCKIYAIDNRVVGEDG